MSLSVQDIIEATNDAEKEGRANERKVIVAWLRSIGAHGGTDGQRVYLGAASEIESGAHLAKAEVRLDWVEGGS